MTDCRNINRRDKLETQLLGSSGVILWCCDSLSILPLGRFARGRKMDEDMGMKWYKFDFVSRTAPIPQNHRILYAVYQPEYIVDPYNRTYEAWCGYVEFRQIGRDFTYEDALEVFRLLHHELLWFYRTNFRSREDARRRYTDKARRAGVNKMYMVLSVDMRDELSITDEVKTETASEHEEEACE